MVYLNYLREVATIQLDLIPTLEREWHPRVQIAFVDVAY